MTGFEFWMRNALYGYSVIAVRGIVVWSGAVIAHAYMGRGITLLWVGFGLLVIVAAIVCEKFFKWMVENWLGA